MKVITLNSEKGGTGKSTFAIHIGAGLAVKGYNVLLIDTDPQGNVAIAFGLPPESGFYDLMVREEPLENVVRPINPSAYALPGEQAKGSLYVVPSNRESYSVATYVDDIDALRLVLDDLEGVDVVIIDTPPTPGLLMRLILEASDYLIAPTELEMLSIKGLQSVVSGLHRANVELMAIVPNKYRQSTNLHTQNLRDLLRNAVNNQWPVWTPVAQRTIWAEVPQLHQMVWTLAPTSQAAKEAWKMIDKVEHQVKTWVGGI